MEKTTTSKLKSIALIAVVALVAVAIANRIKPAHNLINAIPAHPTK